MKKLLAALLLAALLLAGCGSGDDGDGGGSDTKAASEERSGDTNFSGEGSGDFCDLAKKYEEDFEDTDEAGESADLAKEFEELTDAIDKLAAEAPDEIAKDTETIATAFSEYNDLLKKYEYDFTKIPQEEQDEISIENPDVDAASNRVESYFEKVCEMDSDGDGDTDGVIGEDEGGSTDESLPEETDDEQAPADETEATTGE